MSRRRLLAAGALLVVVLGASAAIYVHNKNEPTRKRGSATEEFVTTAEPKPKPKPKDPVPWPTFAYDVERDHLSPYRLRPPFHKLWSVDAHNTLEFPPSVAYGHVYQAQQKGLFFAINAKSGKVRWRKDTGRCSASSPTIRNHVVYQSWMDFVDCPQGRAGASGFVIAWNADTGKKIWKFNTAPVESSPLLVKNTVYVGAWDNRVHAINARTGRQRWSFQGDGQMNTSPAYWKGTIYVASYGGTVYALNARTGKMRWSTQSHASLSGREFFYASPAVAYGRVYIGNSDGTFYVYGAKTGKLRWARPLGTYIYGGAAIYKRRVFVGTYDGNFYALDAATGDVIWQKSMPSAVHSSPTVMDGLVYISVCSSCGQAAQRAVKHGPDGTFALDWRNGHTVWQNNAGKFANPVVADSKRVYLVGRANLFALQPRKKSKRKR
ncbi:MAG TPA: PQQ-binding-like beta-propeller repeat protein [Thermoleophilaceae bacterium]